MKNYEYEEIWKDIVGYEGHYQVSNKGRVKSFKQGKERILKPSNNGWGYLSVQLFKNGEMKMCKVHRLVAKAFLSNPNNLPQINHKDENPSNNRVENLEWCDSKYNNNYGTRNQRVAESLTNGKKSKTIDQFSLDGNFIRTWQSMTQVVRELGFPISSISYCCNGKLKSVGNFKWKYHFDV